MKKKYMTPELNMQLIQMEGLIALSIQDGTATGDDALVKGGGDWDNIWGDEPDEE